MRFGHAQPGKGSDGELRNHHGWEAPKKSADLVWGIDFDLARRFLPEFNAGNGLMRDDVLALCPDGHGLERTQIRVSGHRALEFPLQPLDDFVSAGQFIADVREPFEEGVRRNFHGVDIGFGKSPALARVHKSLRHLCDRQTFRARWIVLSIKGNGIAESGDRVLG